MRFSLKYEQHNHATPGRSSTLLPWIPLAQGFLLARKLQREFLRRHSRANCKGT
jgi:hypothetical protein